MIVIAAWCTDYGDRYRVVPSTEFKGWFDVEWWNEANGRWGPVSLDTTPEGAVEEMMLLASQGSDPSAVN